MINPYHPSSKEYLLLNNLIECIETIKDYTNHCESDGGKINCGVINDLVQTYEEIHSDVLKDASN